MTNHLHFSLTSLNRLLSKVARYVGILANIWQSIINDATQGEYTTGWTGQGASKSDKKVIQSWPSAIIPFRDPLTAFPDRR